MSRTTNRRWAELHALVAALLSLAWACGGSGEATSPDDEAESTAATAPVTPSDEQPMNAADGLPGLDELELGQGWLGVALEAVDAEGNPIERVPDGAVEGTGAVAEAARERVFVRVTQVFPGTPAASSELQPGDLVLRFDDHELIDVQDLIARVQSSSPGTTVTFTLRRGDAEVVQPIMLGLRPELDELLVSIFVDAPAPPLTAYRLSTGEPLSLPDRREAQVTVLDFWATWCGPCRRALPDLNELQERFASHGVRVIGISAEEPEVLREFVAETPIDYTVAYDVDHETTHSYFITAYPTLFVIDAEGIIRHVFVGGSELSELEASVEALTGAPAVD